MSKYYIPKPENRRNSKLMEKNPMWKGDNVSYRTLHQWVASNFGTPQECEDCGTTENHMYHWANINNTYNRDRKNWRRLCVPCHSKMDKSSERRSGEKNAMAKLNKFQVQRIRLMKEITPSLSQRKIAKMFNIGYKNINMILLNKTWKNV